MSVPIARAAKGFLVLPQSRHNNTDAQVGIIPDINVLSLARVNGDDGDFQWMDGGGRWVQDT